MTLKSYLKEGEYFKKIINDFPTFLTNSSSKNSIFSNLSLDDDSKTIIAPGINAFKSISFSKVFEKKLEK